jgi:hypothetical protein
VKVIIREAAARDLDILDSISKNNPKAAASASTGLRLLACLTSGVPVCVKGHESW